MGPFVGPGDLCEMGDGVAIFHQCVRVLGATGPNPSRKRLLAV